MQSRTIVRNVQIIALVGTSIALIAGAAIYSAHASIGQPSAPKQAASPTSEVLSSEDHRSSNASVPAVGTARPSMLEILQSAQAFADAGLLPPQDHPPLIEILRSAQALANAGLLPPPDHPPLIEILQSAQALANAGLLPDQPPLIEILQAAQALANAGLLPPTDGQPSMLEVLTAVNLLAEADAPPEEPVQAPPPQAPVELPPPVLAPVPTSVPPPPPALVVPTASGWYNDAYVARVLTLVNAQRASAGLPPVAIETHLIQSATGYAKVLSDNHWFSHTGPDGSTFIQRIEAAGLPFTVPFGEILAWGTQSWSSESLAQAWMNSPPHRSEILSTLYTRAGASCYFTPPDGVTVYCVIDFAG